MQIFLLRHVIKAEGNALLLFICAQGGKVFGLLSPMTLPLSELLFVLLQYILTFWQEWSQGLLKLQN